MPSLVPTFRLNPDFKRQWAEAIHELAAVARKDSPENLHKLVQQSAGRFVRNVVDITPPARGRADSDAKKRGEIAILGDLLKIAVPVTVSGGAAEARAAREVLSSAEDLMALHHRSRSGAQGRVNPRNRREKVLVAQSVFGKVLTALQHRVGWLAAGLNAAADRLGVHLPAWIRRHGQRFGRIEVTASAHSLRVRIIQDVPYADDVHGYSRRWNFALLKEIKSLRAQAKAIYHKHELRAKAKLKH